MSGERYPQKEHRCVAIAVQPQGTAAARAFHEAGPLHVCNGKSRDARSMNEYRKSFLPALYFTAHCFRQKLWTHCLIAFITGR